MLCTCGRPIINVLAWLEGLADWICRACAVRNSPHEVKDRDMPVANVRRQLICPACGVRPKIFGRSYCRDCYSVKQKEWDSKKRAVRQEEKAK